MKKLVLLLLLSCLAVAQDGKPIPRPFIYGGPQLNGGGYNTLSATVGAGFNVETNHLTSELLFAYDNAHKTDSNTGQDRYARVAAFYRVGHGFFIGGGARWNRLDTALYHKSAWRPQIGGGKDWIRPDVSLRLQAVYVTKGTDRLNAVQGPEISFIIPSPATRHHLFYRQVLGIYEFHQTLNPAQRSVASFLEGTVMYRF